MEGGMNIENRDWFEHTVDVLMGIKEMTSEESKNGVLQDFIALVEKIKNIALISNEFFGKDRDQVLDGFLVNFLKVDEKSRLDGLFQTKLFKELIAKRNELTERDLIRGGNITRDIQQFYKENILRAMFRSYTYHRNKDVGFIYDNPNALEWISAISERILSSKERVDMCETLYVFSDDFKAAIQTLTRRIQMEIGTKNLCECVEIYLTAGQVGDKTPQDVLALGQRFESEIIEGFPPGYDPIHRRIHARRFICVSLGVLERQLPKG